MIYNTNSDQHSSTLVSKIRQSCTTKLFTHSHAGHFFKALGQNGFFAIVKLSEWELQICISNSVGYNIYRDAICDRLKFKTEWKIVWGGN